MKSHSSTWNDDSKTLADNPDTWPETSDTLPVVEPNYVPQNSERIHISINNITTKHSSRSFSTFMMIAGFTLFSILCFWHFGLSESMRSFTITPFLVSGDLDPHAEDRLRVASVDSRDDEEGQREQKTVTIPGIIVTKTIKTLIMIPGGYGEGGHEPTTRTIPGGTVTKIVKTTIVEAASLHRGFLPSSLSPDLPLYSPSSISASWSFPIPQSSMTPSILPTLPSTSAASSPTLGPPLLSHKNNCTSTYGWAPPTQTDLIETVYTLTENITSWLDCDGCIDIAVSTPFGVTLAPFISATLATGPTTLLLFSCLPSTGIALAKGIVTTTATVTAAARTLTATVTVAPNGKGSTSDDTTWISAPPKLNSTPPVASATSIADENSSGTESESKAEAEDDPLLAMHTEVQTIWRDVTVTNG